MRTRRRAKRPEQQLQITVMKYLDLMLPSDAIAFHVPNGGVRSPIEAGIFKAMGVKPGCPDILIFWNGRTFCIELKADEKGLSQAQVLMHGKLILAGCAVATCRSLEDVETMLGYWDVPLRGKIAA